MITKNKPKPHAKRRGWLKNGNPPGDFLNATRCHAKTRSGAPCEAPAMKNGRCRMHGGKSTGPRTREGIEKIRAAHLKHGEYTKEAQQDRKRFRDLLMSLKGTMEELNDLGANSEITIKR
jgi:hypothetical protein